MTGIATARFICGATSCTQTLFAPLFSDGQYTNYGYFEKWHIQLGTDVRPDDTVPDTIVRCPKHCTWIEDAPDPRMLDKFPAWSTRGHWKDAP